MTPRTTAVAQLSPEVVDHRDHTGRCQDEAGGQQTDRQKVAPERTQRRREKDEQHQFRRHVDYRQRRDQLPGRANTDAHAGEGNRRRHAGARHEAQG